jgi:hypothetical protein
MSNDYSRPLLLASATSDVDGDLLTHLQNQTVVVSCDTGAEDVRACRILLNLLRRLPIDLVFDSTGKTSEHVRLMTATTSAVDPGHPLRVQTEGVPDAFRIHVGAGGPPGVLRVIPSRHGAHVVRDGRRIHPAPASPLGSSVAAALGAAEVFKVVTSVVAKRRHDPDHFAFCPVTLTDRPENAPALTDALEFNGALLGLGAIGSATAMILGEFAVTGEIHLVDRQRFGIENVPTYSLGGTPDADREVWKTELAERALARASCTRFDVDVSGYTSLVRSREVPAPRLVLCGLDSIAARHEAQSLWPDTLIDGGTSDTFLGVNVVRGGGHPCLMCFLPARTSGSSYTQLAAVTGLPEHVLAKGQEVLMEADIAGASESQQKKLQPLLGKKICGLAEAMGLTDIPSNGFQPSVSFVSLGSACLVVGRLIAMKLGVASDANFVQYDALFGPTGRTADVRRPLPGCYCVQRAEVVKAVRRGRFPQ